MQIKGIVISDETTDIDYNELKKRNIKYVILRAGFTTYGLSKTKNKDKKYEENYKKALKNNMIISSYYESCAVTENESKEEAEYFLKLIKNKKLSGPIFMLVRDDHSTIIYSDKSQKKMKKKDLTNIISTFCETMKAYEYEVALMSYKYWFDNVIDYNELLKYDNIVIPVNFDKINNINFDVYNDNTIYICKSMINDINKKYSIKIVLKQDCITDKFKSLFNLVIKIIRNKISSIIKKR